MLRFLVGNNLYQLMAQSDAITKLVLLILLLMSIVTLVIFFYKTILMRKKWRELNRAISYVKNVQTIDEIRAMAAAFSHTMPGYFLNQNLTLVKSVLQSYEGELLNDQALEFVQLNIDQTVEEIIRTEEVFLPMLATFAAVSPLLGLFGTVWGLIHAFVAISEKQSADIASVAPGIAEALITTLAGLIVAIPALVLFHYFSSKVRKLERQLFILADKFGWIIQRTLGTPK